MSEYIVKLPDVGEGIAEAEIVDWHVNVGDTVADGQVMVEVMTDKATVELPSPVAGVVLSLGASVGDILAVGSPLIRIDTNGTTTTAPPATLQPAQQPVAELEPASEPVPTSAAPAAPVPAASEPTPSVRSEGAHAAPAVRRRAASLGIDLAAVAGTGPYGRVVHEDLDAYLARQQPASPRPEATADGPVEAIPLVGLRRNIAQRMHAAKQHIPHFTYVEEVDVTSVERLRDDLNERHADTRPRLTFLPFLMRAVVVAIRDFPQMNARFDDHNDVVNRYRSVHLGIATQTEKGLMVAVVKNGHDLDLWASANEVSRLSTAARDNTITLEELTGSTITITSLGALGGIVSTPIINYPEVAIIGVNKIAVRPVYVDGVLLPRQIMNLSSSFDHRVVDGAVAAAFIQRIRALLESPALLFVD